MRSPVSPEVRALFEQERVIPSLSAAQRARAMARARAALQSSVAPVVVPASAPPRTRWLAAVAAALVIGAAVGAAAYEIHARLAPAAVAHRGAVPAPRPIVSAPMPAAPAAAVPEPAPAPSPSLAAPESSPAEAARAELHLLRQARAAVARDDFAAALSSIAQHTRRFKNGRLVEEREALRVKALVGLGRNDEARHAAAAFQARFPRSVLLPTVSQMPDSRP